MLRYTFSLLLLLGMVVVIQAQKTVAPAKPTNIDKSSITIRTDHRMQVPRPAPSIFDLTAANYQKPVSFLKSTSSAKFQFSTDAKTGLPVMISGRLETTDRNASTLHKCYEYLDAVQEQIRIDNPREEFVLNRETSSQAIKHIRMDQFYKGIKVYGGEVVLHEKDQELFLLNGRYYPTPELDNLIPSVSKASAEVLVRENQSNWKNLDASQQLFIAHEQLKSELVIYHLDKKPNQETLAWHISAIPNFAERWEYFIDAKTGVILKKFNTICKLHGHTCSHDTHETATPTESPAKSIERPNALDFFGAETAQATDLKGINRTINVYETGGTYYMIDASRPMFSPSLSSLPNMPTGTIWSIDAFDTSPANSSFSYDHVTSGNNAWNNPTAVSAQYNGGIAFEYFQNTFGRSSINGKGGNIISFINVADEDGQDMDNAFWNGAAMFYGNGKTAFNAPLAKSLDVAGHEMSHGVIQNEANLEYQNESGALNESFADIFGAMIDRDDWKIGEEVANPSIFPTGTMRDMEDPNNGGNSSDFYWQPKHVDEMYTGSQDNGGVHINSGIPNHAYYLFATAIGKDKAEEIFYDVLANYLVASSQFVDLRYAVVQATALKYGSNSTEVNAANNAFNTVGIGEGGGSDYQDDISVNPGNDFILWSDLGLSTIKNALPDGTDDGAFSNTDHISRPSITDDGSIILFINTDNQIVEVDVDWSTGAILDEFILQSSQIWRNVATSKDGSKLAAITTDNNNEIFVFDFNTGSSLWFELYNPTTAEGISTGDIQFPDVLEWDFSGQYILYDAQNTISGQSSSIEYWDIGFVKVWDNASDNFDNGLVSKLFTGLPDNVSIGNPTFSKNSPYIIAFDFIESTTQGVNYEVLGVNTQTGDQGSIWQNNTLGYPSYSIDDREIIFSTVNENQNIIAIRTMRDDKINGVADAFVLIEDAEWATWFATGQRDLSTSTEVLEKATDLSIYPNPVQQSLTVEWLGASVSETQYQLYDLRGQLITSGNRSEQTFEIKTSQLTAGSYFLRVFDGEKMIIKKIIKQ